MPLAHAGEQLRVALEDVLGAPKELQIDNAAAQVLFELPVIQFALLPSGGDGRYVPGHEGLGGVSADGLSNGAGELLGA